MRLMFWPRFGAQAFKWASPVISIPPSFESAPDLLKHQRQERTVGARAPSQCVTSILPYQENESDEGANFHCWRASKGLLPW